MDFFNKKFYDTIWKMTLGNVDSYNAKILSDNKSNGIDADSFYDSVFAFIIMKFLIESHIEKNGETGEFQIFSLDEETGRKGLMTVSGNLYTDTFSYKESFFTKILPGYYTDIFYKNTAFVEQCIRYIDEELQNLDS